MYKRRPRPYQYITYLTIRKLLIFYFAKFTQFLYFALITDYRWSQYLPESNDSGLYSQDW